MTGGVGRFAKGMAESFWRNASRATSGNRRKTPILRRFTGKIGPEQDAQLFYDARKEAKQLETNAAQARKDRRTGVNVDEAKQHLADTQVSSQKAIFERADTAMKRLREQEAKISASAQPYEVQREELTAIRQQMREVQNKARAESTKLKRQGASP
jgi:uncharacterized membrane-anchored protein